MKISRRFISALAVCAFFAPAVEAQQPGDARQYHVPERSETYNYVAPEVEPGLPLEVESMRKRIAALEASNEELRGHVAQLTEAFNLFLDVYSGKKQAAPK